MDPEQRKKIKFQNDTLRELCQNRKRENFEQLKNWDQSRAMYLTTHRKVADEIEQALQNRLSESNEFMRVVVQFLMDIESQQKKYEAESVANPESKLKINSISRNIHITSAKCLQRIHNTTQNFKGFRKMKEVLEGGVKAIEQASDAGQRDVMDIRTKIELHAVEIQNTNADTTEKCNKVVSYYKQDKTAKIFQAEVDLFQLQKDFIHQTIHQTQIQRNFGLLVFELLDSVENYERSKLSLVKDILEKYLQAARNARQDNETAKSLLDILQKQTEEQYIDLVYSSEELLSKEVLKEVRKAEKKFESEPIDMKEIRKFLQELKCPSFDCRNLILKEYRLYFKSEEELWNCLLLVTVDGFMHVYQSREEETNEQSNPDYSVALMNLEMAREGDINLNITVKKWQFLNFREEEVNGINFVFMNEDQREEFIQFINKMISN